jgi:ankyrin repeat protein
MKSQIRLIVLGCISCLCLVGCGPAAPQGTLHQAVEKGNLKAVQQHIAAKSDLNKKNSAGWTPLHLAAMKGDLAIVKALVKAGADMNRKGKDGKTPLDVAGEKGQTAIVKFLQEPNQERPSRRLIDGGLGVGEALDNM